ncbi:MAG: YraN family protein [Rhodothermales bacterium]|nr:YraN family protein [Rhodothermales bacterium]
MPADRTSNNQEKGARGEDLAAAYLEGKGFTVVERNYRAKRGEIDLICRHIQHGRVVLVFVEVKMRRGVAFGRPEEAVDARKQVRMEAAAEAYLHLRGLGEVDCRFDVVGILAGEPPRIRHFVDVFGL